MCHIFLVVALAFLGFSYYDNGISGVDATLAIGLSVAIYLVARLFMSGSFKNKEKPNKTKETHP